MKTLKSTLVGFCRSILFMAFLLGLHRWGLCYVKNFAGKLKRRRGS